MITTMCAKINNVIITTFSELCDIISAGKPKPRFLILDNKAFKALNYFQ